MFYHLLYPLTDSVSFFNLFKYITFRSAGAILTALIVSLIFGPLFIRVLKGRGVKETIRQEGPKSHYAKEGTPTMGGIIILAAIIIPTLLWADLTNRFIQLILFVTVWMGAIGFMDDYMKAILRHPKGMVGKYKLAGQVICGLILGLVLYYYAPFPTFGTTTEIPFVKDYILNFSSVIVFVPFVVLVITGSSNAVNLSDGLDGLATGLCGIAFVAFAGFAYVSGRNDFSQYLQIMYLEGAGELTIYCAATMGAALGFLWYNSHPAEIFMGDTGALALGGAMGAIAIMLKKELLLLIVGGVFVAEALSVILQVSSFKLRGVRIFKMAPLHHHFEQLGWPETKVVTRFWIIGVICALLTLATLKVR
ncbi:MAG: phospho-N-acetylmuramoyl-pentapeptide-transferase [candidate division Zixibacteria bacterium]|nr:phospho-N-acetylmuramoyl-pentapeptide-transferase [candidate division Zixibacteria bacterium]MBU1469437.1 phospho-N-acetylmuramoyl-pentapeptide-transferase [candidate division Zixibacteria bacterium]MBU2624191.1 phospho-N-acetylmuramoyl-pentapeptide-transferase [candidate division Zixibacteria bacterium]